MAIIACFVLMQELETQNPPLGAYARAIVSPRVHYPCHGRGRVYTRRAYDNGVLSTLDPRKTAHNLHVCVLTIVRILCETYRQNRLGTGEGGVRENFYTKVRTT